MIDSNYFSFRARCKYCGEKPTHYIFQLDKLIPKNIKSFLDLKYYFMKHNFLIKEFCTYGDALWKRKQKIQITNLSFNSADISCHKNYNPTIGNRLKEFLICPCNSTMWAYTDISNYRRHHIINSKCKYGFPSKVIF